MNKYFLILLILNGTLTARAQEEKQLLPSEIKRTTILTEPITLNKGFVRNTLSYAYIFTNIFIDNNGKRMPIPENIFQKSWFLGNKLSYGISNRFQVGVDILYNITELKGMQKFEAPLFDFVDISKYDNSGSGFGDMGVLFKYQLLKERNGQGLTGNLEFYLPTGRKNPDNIIDEDNYRAPSGRGHSSIAFGVSYRKVMFPVTYSFYVDYTLNLKGNKQFVPGGDEQEFKKDNLILLGGFVGFHMNDWLAFVNRIYLSDNMLNSRKDPDVVYSLIEEYYLIQYVPTLSFQIKQLRFSQAMSVPVIGKMTGGDVTYILSIGYVF